MNGLKFALKGGYINMNSKQVAEIRNYKVYRHVLPNGKAYIGTTSMEKLYDRFNYGHGYEHQAFGEAIFEYGWSQVKTEILEEITGTYKDATVVEAYWIKKSIDEGYEVYNKHYAAKEKEYKYNCGGCTIIDTNIYYSTFKAAADFIGVTKQAVGAALRENRACKGWNLAYGDVTNKEEEENE